MNEETQEVAFSQPKRSEDRNGLSVFVRKYSISNYRHLQHMRNIAMENLFFDIFENACIVNKKLYPAQRQKTIKKPIYVKTNKHPLHVAEMSMQEHRSLLQQPQSVRAKTKESDSKA